MEARDILTIYLADNALINQKNTYYFAANALLLVPVVNIYSDDGKTAALLCGLGVVFSVISVLSIARTAAFRGRWRGLLESKDAEYKEIYSNRELSWWGKLPSNPIHMAPPFIGLCMWVWGFFRLWWV